MTKKILVIDDDELMLMALSNALEAEDRILFSTADGPRGIEICETEQPDLVLLDIGLPSVNGLDVLRKIRKVFPAIRVIIITGYASSQAEAEAMRLGAYGFYAKGADVDQLSAIIQAALDEPDSME